MSGELRVIPAGGSGDRRTGRAGRRRSGPVGAIRMFATTVPGLAPLAAREFTAIDGVETLARGHDGRADLVFFAAAPRARRGALGCRLVEDLFVEVGQAARSAGDDPQSIAARLWQPRPVERALSVRSQAVVPLHGRMTFRVVVRVRQERAFLRTDLRQAMAFRIAQERPRWRLADPAELEIWVCEYRPGQFVAGLRLSGAALRQHGGRVEERRGALRPAVAAAMVRLAGDPDGDLLDPCCGAGTILAEAVAAGWRARGSDLDPRAVAVARRNVPGVEVSVADARRIAAAAGSIASCVSNLPFGRQFEVQGGHARWLAGVLGELGRATRPGGRVVLLAPAMPRAVVPSRLRLDERWPIRLLGTPTCIWSFVRSP